MSTMSLIFLVFSIIGLILSIILIFYVRRLGKEITKKDSIVVTVLGGLGIIFGMYLGGILVLVGGIIGIVKCEEENIQAKPVSSQETPLEDKS